MGFPLEGLGQGRRAAELPPELEQLLLFLRADPTFRSLFTGRGFALPGPLRHEGSTAGFFAATPATKQTVSGAKGGNAALGSLLAALAAYGLVTDSSSA